MNKRDLTRKGRTLSSCNQQKEQGKAYIPSHNPFSCYRIEGEYKSHFSSPLISFRQKAKGTKGMPSSSSSYPSIDGCLTTKVDSRTQ
jgi:hypothetical protein